MFGRKKIGRKKFGGGENGGREGRGSFLLVFTNQKKAGMMVFRTPVSAKRVAGGGPGGREPPPVRPTNFFFSVSLKKLSVDLIICLAIKFWMVYKRWFPLTCGEVRVICIASRNRLHSRPFFFASLLDFETILGGLGKPKCRSKSILERLFSDVCFNCVSASFGGRFLEGRTFKNQ